MEKMKLLYIKHDQLKTLPENPRKTKDVNAIKKLSKLISEHGFQNPLQVYKENSGYVILCGNHRFLGGKLAGMVEFPCILYDGDKNRAIARAVSDNKSNEWTEWDFPKLNDILVELDDGAFDMDLLGFDEGELERLLGGSPNDPNAEWQGMPEYEQDEAGSFKRIIVHFATQSHVDEFSKLISQSITEKTKFIWHPKLERENLKQYEIVDES